MFVVVVTEKGGGKQRLELSKNLVHIGRVHGNDVVLPRGNVSKNHAIIERRGDGFVLSDMGSTNGTYVNGRRVLEPQALKPEDKIYVGDFILSIELKTTPVPEPAPEGEAPAPGAVPLPPLPLPAAPGPPVPKPSAVPEKADRLPAPKPPRPSVPSPTVRMPAPTEKRIPLPKLTPVPASNPPSDPPLTIPTFSSPPPLPSDHPPKDGSANLADSVIVQAAKSLALPDLIHGPMALDVPTAAAVRAFVSRTVDKLQAEGKLPEGHLPGNIKGRVYRRCVALGPIGAPLNDREVRKLRILSPTSISIFTDGKWRNEQETFENHDTLRAAVALLSAGRVAEGGLSPSSRRFYTEEGWLVHIAHSSDGIQLTLDKTPAFDGPDTFGEAESHLLTEAVVSGSNILIIGPSLAARRAVFFRSLQLLPSTEFTAVTGEIGGVPEMPSKRILLDVSSSLPDFEIAQKTALRHALSMSPDRLTATGFTVGTIRDVLAAASGRGKTMAELPLGGKGSLAKELAAVLGAAGLSVTPAQAAVYLTEAFNLVVVTECVREDVARIKSIYTAAISDKGGWMPHVLYNREVTT